MATATVPIEKGAATGLPHFTVHQADLVRELSLAIGAVEKKTTIPILSQVKLTAGGDFIAITATDLELAFMSRCAARVAKSGAITLPAKKLLDFVRLLPDADIDIKVTPNHWASITDGRSKARIAGMSVESFPEIPSVDRHLFNFSAAAFARLIRQTEYAISKEESRFTLNGARFESSPSGLRMIATDGHRLTLADSSGPMGEADGGYLISHKALIEVGKLIGSSEGGAEVQFAQDDNHYGFCIGQRAIIARKKEGTFPDYQRIIAPIGDYSGRATVEREALRGALRRVANFADERSRAVKMTIGNGQIVISAAAMESGESEESVPAGTNGNVVMGFNAQYILDFLGSTDADQVLIEFRDEKSAAVFSPVVEQGDRYVCIVMPLRI